MYKSSMATSEQPELDARKFSTCKYQVHYFTQQCKRCFYIFLRKEMEMDTDNSEIFKREIRELELRKLPFSKTFNWKDSGQLKIVVSAGDLHKDKEFPSEKVAQMNFSEKMIVRLGAGNDATKYTVTIEIFDVEESKCLCVDLQDVSFIEQPPETPKSAIENEEAADTQ